MSGNYNIVAAGTKPTQSSTSINWGQGAKRSMYHVSNNQGISGSNSLGTRNLLNSRLWHGVPQLSNEQLKMFEAAYVGHTFIFVVNVPRFMTSGYYAEKDMHYQMKNLKAVMERASMGFSGVQNIMANSADQDDGNGRKVSHIVNVTKEQGNITVTLHEFAGLPVKNAIENWLTGIYDYRSQHGNYHGNLGILGGWCLANHSMSMLVVQVTPDWTTIQDAAYYYNMVPTEVPFQHFEWTKGEQTIVQDYDIEFYANEERSPAIMYAAEKYMNNRILTMVETSVYNSRQFVANKSLPELSDAGAGQNLSKVDSLIDPMQYNMYITNAEINNTESDTLVGANKDKYNKSIETVKLNDDGTTQVAAATTKKA